MRTSRLRMSVLAVAVWMAALATSVPGAQQPATAPAPPASARSSADSANLQPVINKYCVGCHNQRTTTSATVSGVLLDRADLSRVADDPAMWEKVIRKLRAGAMPPAGLPRPDAATRDALVSFLETTLDRRAVAQPNPGRHLPHRLNRAEYENAIRDLLALDVDASTLLPPDDSVDGFDNNADVLGVSPSLLERYLSAAARISALAVGNPSIGAGSETYRIRGDASQTGQDEALPPGTRGGLMARHTFPLDGEYVIKVKLLEINLGSIRGLEYQHQLEVTVDGERVLLAPVGGPDDYTQSSLNSTNVVNALAERLQVRVKVKAGQRDVGAAFLQKPASQGGTKLQPFLRSTLIATDHLGMPHVENVTVTGPFNPTGVGDTASRRRLFTCAPTKASDEKACAEKIVSALARRAYRRPVTASELSSLMKFYDAGRSEESFDRGIELAVRAVLVSPKFIFRIERDPVGVALRHAYRVSDLDLASRLSFFLWSSLPDDELLDAGQSWPIAQGRRYWIGRFAGCWPIRGPKRSCRTSPGSGCSIRNLRSTTPGQERLSQFRRQPPAGVRARAGSVRRQHHRRGPERPRPDDRRLHVRERAAGQALSHSERVRPPLPQSRGHARSHARGCWARAGFCCVTSHADRTSPVVRGKWILDNLIGTPPPPPPPDVPPFPEETPGVPKTVRARMEQHRANPQCARAATGSWTRSGSRSRISTPLVSGGRRKQEPASMPRRARGWQPDRRCRRAARLVAQAARGARQHDDGEAPDLCARPDRRG